MPTNFCFVPNPAQGQPHKAAPQGPRNGLPERRFAYPRRADKTENGTLHLLLELADAQIFQNPLFNRLQPIVVLVQDPPRLARSSRSLV